MKGPRRSGPSLVLKAKVSPQHSHYDDELFENSQLECHSAIRATARTTNLTVILFGAGLTTVLIYALTSELFSRNSPTVLYNEACERIKSSPRVCGHARQLIYILNMCRLRNIYQDYWSSIAIRLPLSAPDTETDMSPHRLCSTRVVANTCSSISTFKPTPIHRTRMRPILNWRRPV
jgi:hypothetical protein